MRRLILFLLLSALAIIFPIGPSFAQTPTPETSIEEMSFQGEFSINPPIEEIDETTRTVNITFHDLTADKVGYSLCTGDKVCLIANNASTDAFPISLLDPDQLIKLKGSTDGNGDITMTVCGNGSKKVKTDCDEGDWFHGGNIYYFSIGVVKENTYRALKQGAFSVARSYPDVRIDPRQGLTTNSQITVSLSQTWLRPGGDKRNNYQIAVEGGEAYKSNQCLTINTPNTPVSKTFSNFTVGVYVIKINERVDDTGLNKGCSGGFTYYESNCNITNTSKGGGSCSDPNKSRDPEGEEYKAFLADLAELTKVSSGIAFPCGKGDILAIGSYPNPTNCPKLNTAIGPIQITPQGFIQDIFTFVLTIAGFGAIIIIIYAGYVLMTSRGDKEKIAGARETLTSAILGLLFIILSIVILEIIGFDILKIPGITR